MSSRTTRSLALGLVSSALILALFFTCSGCDDDPNNPNSRNYASGHTGSRSYYRSRPFFFGWGGSGYRSGPTVHTSTVGHTTSSGSTSRSSGSSATSRGGFGGSGSAHSSGS